MVILFGIANVVQRKKIGNADEKAREIIDEALKTAEAKKREGLLEVKEESIRTKNELDKEIKERRAEAQRYAYRSNYGFFHGSHFFHRFFSFFIYLDFIMRYFSM